MAFHNKKKIINDPVYGFIGVPNETIYDLISHPWFGRLRNIRQLGLTHLVYPGAVHTRFHHALGTLHLANLAIETLLMKGVEVSPEESDGLRIALLLHDLGHSPFSHSLEFILVQCGHELLTEVGIQKLDVLFKGKLSTARQIFENTYPKTFFHQLVSGQMDLDRLDYLNRDSFYTGVSEGVVSFDRIIKMLDVRSETLVLEEKALYSIENFLIARRLMYLQVYFHKTVIASEQMLLKIIQRAQLVTRNGEKLFSTPSLQVFLKNEIKKEDLLTNPIYFESFMDLDDTDIWSSIKEWTKAKDRILSQLSKALVERNLYHIEFQNKPFSESEVLEKEIEVMLAKSISKEEIEYFVFTGLTSHLTYNNQIENINILRKDGNVLPFLEMSGFFDSTEMGNPLEKHFLCHIRF